MLSGYRLQRKEIKDSHRSLQPPTLSNSNILSSQDRGEAGDPQQFHGLSNVQQKSYQSSQQNEPDNKDFNDFLVKMDSKDHQDYPEPPKHKKTSSNHRRIQDQQIIVVEEQHQIGSDHGGNESFILQHIDFNQEEKVHEDTPEWEVEQYKNKQTDDKNKYVINYMDPAPAWQAQDHQNVSNSSPYQFSSSELKNNPIRHSKNTCIERTDSRDEANFMNIHSANKSCIAKPMNYSGKEYVSSPLSSNQPDIHQILNRWNQQIYPEMEAKYLQSQNVDEGLQKKRNTVSYDMERDAKYCYSNYNLGSIKYESQQLSRDNQIKTKISIGQQNKQVQTDRNQSGQQNRVIQNLKMSIEKYQQQNARLQQKSRRQGQQLVRLKQTLKIKQGQFQRYIQNLQQTQVQSRQDKLWVEQSKRLQQKNRQLEKILNQQNNVLKQFQSKNDVLEKKLHQTVSYLQTSAHLNLPQSKSMRLQKFDTFGQPNKNLTLSDHSLCIAKIQALQEHIFDVEQQTVGMEVQIQKRVRIIGDHMELELRRNINEEYRVMIATLKDELSKSKELNKILNCQKSEMVEKLSLREKEMQIREEKVKKMYNELVVQWKEVDKEKDRARQKRNSYPGNSATNNNNFLSPKSANNYQYTYGTQRSAQLYKKIDYISQPQNGYFSNKDLISPIQNKYNSIGNMEHNSSFQHLNIPELSFGKRYHTNGAESLSQNSPIYGRLTFGTENKWSQKLKEPRENHKNNDARQNYELNAINSKIQKLRKQINRQLDLIH